MIKKYILLITILLLISCSNEMELLKKKMILMNEIDSLENEVINLKSDIKVMKENKKYVLKLKIYQSRVIGNLNDFLKDYLNESEFEIAVDKDFYHKVKKGQVLNSDLRIGSLVLKGTFSRLKVKVVDKYVK